MGEKKNINFKYLHDTQLTRLRFTKATIHQSPSDSLSELATLAFLDDRAAANASANEAGAPEFDVFAAALDMVGASPFASCSNTLGLSSCDLSTLRSAPTPPAFLIDASRASLSSDIAGVVCAGPAAGGGVNTGIPGGGGGGGAAEEPAAGGAVCVCKGGGGGGGGARDCCC